MKRCDIKVGFSCNNNCIFCAQAHKRHLGDLTTEEIKVQLKKGIEDGADEVVFTGGEPTIRPDIVKLVKYAKDIGFKWIQIQSNCRMCSYIDFVKKLIKAGANEFSPSIHGHTPELHDSLVRSKGAWKQTYQAIKNLKSLGQYVMTNTVVVKQNYKYLPQIAQMLVNLKVDQFQLAFVHATGNAAKYFDIVVPRVKDVAPYVHKALDIARKYKVRAMVEAFPFCLMKGYEEFVSELYIPIGEIRESDMFIAKYEDWRLNEGKRKSPKCKECKYDLICEGPWREYPEHFGFDEFIPVKGEKIKSKDEILKRAPKWQTKE